LTAESVMSSTLPREPVQITEKYSRSGVKPVRDLFSLPLIDLEALISHRAGSRDHILHRKRLEC